jgi:Kef-type K+ transport system membrane component KefB
MIEYIQEIFTKISLLHLNILFLLGLGLFGGILGGRFFQKLRIPQVVGYILIGVALGDTLLKVVDQATIARLQPFSYFALGIIGFMVGGELKKDIFAKYGKQLITILLCEGIAPFLLVSVFTSVTCGFLFGDWRISVALGLLFGAIASATDPATTTEVLREYKTRGPLTRTILGIVALDDGLALLLFVIASSIAGALTGTVHTSLFRTLIHPVYEIGGAAAIGIGLGFVLTKILRTFSDEPRLLTFSIGTVLLTSGLALAIHVDMLLAVMTLGVVVVNFTPRKSKDIFKLIEGVAPPIFVLFFVLVGAKLDLSQLSPVTLLLVGLYLSGMAIGKVVGSRFGARISGAPPTVRRYLAFSMFPQAGVAIGLSILASQYFPGHIGNTVVIVITTTTFITQLIGPALTKYGVTKAKEVGLNITEEDLVDKTIAGELMDKNPPLIYKDMHLSEILNIFSKSINLYYPVVDRSGKALGVITVDSIRNIFMETGLSDLLLAVDLMEKAPATVESEATLATIKESLEAYDLECIAVVDAGGLLQGFIEKRTLNRYITTKILELQRTADSLEGLS